MERNEAIDVIKRNYPHVTESGSQFETALRLLIPELKESDDEKIRKYIKRVLENLLFTEGSEADVERKEAIAWLEKQGEQMPTDKVEPKFHKGEWITHNTANFVFKIINFGTNGYEVINRENFKKTISFDNEENYHLWTIQDAKAGDMLIDKYNNVVMYQEPCSNLLYHSFCFVSTKVFVDSGGSHFIKGTYPATKEQRDLLFQKMKEAGYKWDAEKKELKKIEQSLTWSEEDEKIYQSIMDDTVQENQLDGKQIDWLRDIKYRHFSQPQNTWKPSDLQIKALEYYTKGGCVDKEGIFGSELVKLLEELKKLREE